MEETIEHELVSAAYLAGYRARVAQEQHMDEERRQALARVRAAHLRAKAIEGTDADPLVQARKALDEHREMLASLRRKRRRWL